MAGYTFTDFLVCPHDGYSLAQDDCTVTCPGCSRSYSVRDGIARMLPEYSDDRSRRYVASYDGIARDDLEKPLEGRRDVRHTDFLHFIGPTRGKRILDIGSSNALYLADMEADLKVALDIALPYLEAIPADRDVMRVCADAEHLPIAAGFFDIVIISGVLEHVLAPEKVVARVHQVCRPDTRVIVLVPWEEDLAPYRDLPWEFTHLRTFSAFTFSQLWHQFRIVRKQGVWPRLSDPILFRLDERLPLPLFDLLRFGYFHRGLAAAEADRRTRWYEDLPRRQRWLMRFYRPTFYQFELRTYSGSRIPSLYDRLAGLGSLLAKPFRRRSVGKPGSPDPA